MSNIVICKLQLVSHSTTIRHITLHLKLATYHTYGVLKSKVGY